MDNAPKSKLSSDFEARLVAPLFTNVGSLLPSHIACLLLCIPLLIRVGGIGSMFLVLASAATFALRLHILDRVRRLPPCPAPEYLLRWRGRFQAVGLVWCVTSAALCGVWIAIGTDFLRLLAFLVILGTAATIAVRNANAPRFATIQIAIWMVPLTPIVPHMARHIEHGGTLAILLAALYFFVLRSVVTRGHKQVLAIIEADLTRDRARLALVESETALSAIFNNAGAGITEIDVTNFRYLRVNRVFREMVGRSEAELIGDFDLTGLVHPDDLDEKTRRWVALRETGQSFECERRYIRPDGTLVWAQLSAAVSASDPQGRPLRAVVMTQDITKRKMAEADLRASQALLVLSLEIGGVGTFRRDYVAGLIYCGRETRSMIGVPPGEGPVLAEDFNATMLPEDMIRFVRQREDSQAERRPIVTYDYRFNHPDKGVRFAETRSRVEYDETGRAVTSVGVVIDVTERRRTQDRLAYLAHHDPLTDLPNRSLFRVRLDAALEQARSGGRFALLYLDLDSFKDVNDSLGHPIGDTLLKAVTARLKIACRASDTVARLGGDEFAMIVSPLKQIADASIFAERINASLAAPFMIDGHKVSIGTSIGIVVAPDDSLDPDVLLRDADVALYEAKAEGRGRHRFFVSAMHEKVKARRTLDNDLRQAMQDGNLELFYQPLVGLKTKRIRGFEALLRWRHPERGIILPESFIPLAESNGLIVPIGAFVLQRACAQASLWPGDTSIAVNLSAAELSCPGLFQTIESAIGQSSLNPTRLELEITESTMLQDTKATIETLHKLKTMGVRISIDDFGTGFSSLGYLQRFPFDKVKIDQSFIAPLGRTKASLAIVDAVVNLCADLDIETTAEGVETEGQLAILSNIGCTEGQGYYFCRPAPIEEMSAWGAKVHTTAH